MSSLLTALGFTLVVHAAYSALHYRSLLQDLDLEEAMSIPPSDVYVEIGAAFFLLLAAELLKSASFQRVEITHGKRRSLVAPGYKTRDFDIYKSR